MTEPPQDDGRRPAPGPPQPYPRPQPYGSPQPYGPPAWGQQPPGPQQPLGPYYGAGPPRYGPQYGPPGPPPYAPPAPKSRVGLIAATTGLILLLIAGSVVLALTLGSTVLEHGAVERDVGAQFEELHGVAVDLACPGDMEIAKGAGYECTGTTAAGEEVTLQITIDDEEAARYSWTEP